MVYSALTLTILVVGAVLLFVLYSGGYFSAWFSSFVLAVIALIEIDIREIATIRPVGKREMSRMFPVFGAAGFFGYYGKYFDFKEFETVTIYASEWRNFVEIIDIYDSRTYVSCREADHLTALVRQAQDALAQENISDDEPAEEE